MDGNMQNLPSGNLSSKLAYERPRLVVIKTSASDGKYNTMDPETTYTGPGTFTGNPTGVALNVGS